MHIAALIVYGCLDTQTTSYVKSWLEIFCQILTDERVFGQIEKLPGSVPSPLFFIFQQQN